MMTRQDAPRPHNGRADAPAACVNATEDDIRVGARDRTGHDRPRATRGFALSGPPAQSEDEVAVKSSALLRDPLVPFLAVGALCYALFSTGEDVGRERVVVTPAVREGLARDHLDMTGREPDAAELAELVERWVADEVRFREALAR
ncbi:MAG: hypothetical protein V2J24_05850, partial [Pseudomonadales bacterium]|nr:hypothetical protein [Pseudomonadales bacterium]